MKVVHNFAQLGFGTGTNELYDRARPSYPAKALAQIRKASKTDGPINVVEIGSGTGIFTRALLEHPDWVDSIAELRAIEPSLGMRETFSKAIQDPRVSVAEGVFEWTEVEAGWADIIIVAQAFHWCPDYDKASREFARILKPDGIVAFIWNMESRRRAGWVAQLRERIEQYEEGTPQFRLGLWRQAFDTEGYKEFFQPPQERTWEYVLTATTELVVDRASSKSYIAVLPEDIKKQVQQDVRNIVEKGEGKVWIEEEKDVFEYPYETWLVLSHRL